MTAVPGDLLERLRKIEVSTLCDADKTIPIVDPVVRALVPGVRMAGVARTVVAEDDHLSVLTALAAARPDDVLVIVTNGGQRAILGELVATEAVRRGVAGIVVDGFIRDVQGIRKLGLPLFARGTYPASGSVVGRPEPGPTVRCGGVDVAPGDIVFGDDDGIVIAPLERVAAAVEVPKRAPASSWACWRASAEACRCEISPTTTPTSPRSLRGQESKMEFLPDPADG